MAKVLIPFSGGVNSTYVLHRWLTETDHEIIASYSEEEWLDNVTDDPWRGSREKNAAQNMVNWLKSNVRDFTFEIVQWPNSYVENQVPIREGFTETVNLGILEPRYSGYKSLIDRHLPDGIVIGISLENTATDSYERLRDVFETDGVDVYFAGSRTLDPIAKGEAFNHDAIAATLSGRFEQLESIPTDLQALMAVGCDCDRPEDQKFLCLPCGYEKTREVLSDMTGKEFDEMFAEYGSYGSWRSEADPATYKYRGFPYRKFAEIIGKPDNVGFD
jgi:hypothetical protein